MYLNDRGPFGDAAPAPTTGGSTVTNVISGIAQGLASVFGKPSPAPVVAPAASNDIDLTTIAIVGAVGLGAFLILRKKKS